MIEAQNINEKAQKNAYPAKKNCDRCQKLASEKVTKLVVGADLYEDAQSISRAK